MSLSPVQAQRQASIPTSQTLRCSSTLSLSLPNLAHSCLRQTKPLWREAEVRSLVSHLLSMLRRYRTDQAERNPDRFLSGEEVARSEALFDWSQDLEVTLLYYLKHSTDPRKRWIQVKLELKRLELLSRNPVKSAFILHLYESSLIALSIRSE